MSRYDPEDQPHYFPLRDELKRQIKDMKILGLIVVSKDAAELMKIPVPEGVRSKPVRSPK